jgi:hypothetical protein
VDPTQPRCGAFCRAVWAKLGSKRLWWERLRALGYAYRLDARRALWEALWYGFATPPPILSTDASALPAVSLTCGLGPLAIPSRHRRRLRRSPQALMLTPTSCDLPSWTARCTSKMASRTARRSLR